MGRKIAAPAISAADAGSDVANIRTRARRDGDDFIVDGQKIFISAGSRGDFIQLPCAPVMTAWQEFHCRLWNGVGKILAKGNG
ncbi:MAG: acyl-CoA dehydrogenase family protein [Rhodospirillaceae bacterium]